MKETAGKLQVFLQALTNVSTFAQHPVFLAFLGLERSA